MLTVSDVRRNTPESWLNESISTSRPDRRAVAVALDGSRAAERVLPSAVALAKRWQAPLRLVQVREAANTTTEKAHVEKRSVERLEAIADSLRETHDLPVVAQALVTPSITTALYAICETSVRALVMATTARAALSRLWKGEVSDELIGQLSVPLVLVPPNVTDDAAFGLDANRILVHLDGSQSSENLLRLAVETAGKNDVCHLLRVLPLASLFATGRGGFSPAADIRNLASLELMRASEWLAKHGVASKVDLILDGRSPGPAIVDQVNAIHASLVILAARKRSIRRWLAGGIADHVAGHVTVPVMVVPPKYQASRQMLRSASDSFSTGS